MAWLTVVTELYSKTLLYQLTSPINYQSPIQQLLTVCTPSTDTEGKHQVPDSQTDSHLRCPGYVSSVSELRYHANYVCDACLVAVS